MDLSARSICPCSGCSGASWPRSQVSLEDVTRWPGACHPPPGPAIRPHSSVRSVQPQKKKIRHVYWESRFFIWEEVKTRGDVVQVCVVRGHSLWYANVLVHRTLQQLISNFNVLNKVSNFCVEKRFLSGKQSIQGSWVHEEEIALNSCQRYILFVYWFR